MPGFSNRVFDKGVHIHVEHILSTCLAVVRLKNTEDLSRVDSRLNGKKNDVIKYEQE